MTHLHRASSFVAIVAAVIVIITTSSCSKKANDEALIRKVLDDGVAALEARDAAAAAEFLHEDYGDKSGRTRDKLKGLAFFALQQGPVLVKLGDVQVTVAADRKTAKAKVNALAVQGSGELKTARDLLPTNARAFDLDVSFSKSTGDWLISGIEGIGAGSDW